MASNIKLVDPAHNEYLASLERKGEHENHFFRAMANKPEALKNFVPFYHSVMTAGSVDHRIKELVYLAVSYVNECTYCIDAHTRTGAQAGISDEEMRAVQTEQDHSFTPSERAALQYSRELTRTCDVEDVSEEVNKLFTDEQLVELTLVVALANFTNRFNNGLGLKPE
ncbi:MAG: carboxymuconolactone decarboxylase family protein [Acidobacteriota bacterium]|nr:carboxymuconolactone decarboxylase family protein [Acidobacteriota bacterium]